MLIKRSMISRWSRWDCCRRKEGRRRKWKM